MKTPNHTTEADRRVDEALTRCEGKAQRYAVVNWIDVLDDIDDMALLKEAIRFCRLKAEANALSYAIWHPRMVRVRRLIDAKMRRIADSESGVGS